MQKKLTLSIDAEIYEALHKMAGKRKIGRFIESLVRPHITSLELPEAGARLAQDELRNSAALSWAGTNRLEAGDEAR
jgi:predicted CopG family antitoxin